MIYIMQPKNKLYLLIPLWDKCYILLGLNRIIVFSKVDYRDFTFEINYITYELGNWWRFGWVFTQRQELIRIRSAASSLQPSNQWSKTVNIWSLRFSIKISIVEKICNRGGIWRRKLDCHTMLWEHRRCCRISTGIKVKPNLFVGNDFKCWKLTDQRKFEERVQTL